MATYVQQEAPHLLIVDDEAINLELMRRIFIRNYRITTANGGKEALRLLALEEFDVVLLDIMMPIMSGFDVLRSIRENAKTADLPVILISALSASDDIATGLKLGANDYVTKPIDITVVQARVDTQATIKRFMDERKQIIAQLQVANQMKMRLMQVASHDLKNPLNNLRLLHQVIRRKVAAQPDLEELLIQADAINQTMLNVISEFLDASLINDHALMLEIEALEVAVIVREVVAQYHIAAHNKNIRFHVSDLTGVIMADANRLSQVLSNLISNAIKYSPHGSTISISTQQHGNLWQLNVLDQGPGIPESERHALFEPFSKISNQPTGGESSTGLGLWIVREMMRLQRGSVGFECPPAGGTNFWIRLPLAEVGVN